MILGCSSDPEPPAGPDPKRVFEERSRVQKHLDAPFQMETVTRFRTTDRLPDLDVRALLFAAGRIHVGTPSGLYREVETGEAFEAVAGVEGSVVDLALGPPGEILVAMPGGVARLLADGTVSTHTTSTGAGLVAVASAADHVFAATSSAVFELESGGFGPVQELGGLAVRDLAGSPTELFVATLSGVVAFAPGTRQARRIQAPDEILDDDVRALALDEATLLVASASGLSVRTNPPRLWRAEKGGLPNADLLAVSARNGAILSGHAIGANAIDPSGKLDHYHTQRWIMDERVQAVALSDQGDRWVGTAKGLTKISLQPTTLAAKAEHYETLLDRHWRMDGFLDEEVSYPDPYALEATPRTDDNDNDGLWTEMQIAPWCFAYAITHDERYYQKARRAMDVMMMEFDVPALTFEASGKKRGFITRSLVRDDEGAVFSGKATQSNWHLQTFEGREYYWKDDTSSDEYAGHFFGIPVFYDLCAKTDEERAEIASRVRSAMDYIIENGYDLLDLDGARTTHGVWSKLAIAVDTVDGCPEKHSLVECVFSWGGGGWLNSLEILGHLLAAWHITQDQKYYDEYDRLFSTERYGEMIPIKESTATVMDPAFENHSDHELAMLSYYTLMRYEPNPERREIVIDSVRKLLETELGERNPWHIATVATAFAGEIPVEDAVRTLQELSLDSRLWGYDNGHRKDAKKIVADRHGSAQFDRVFPYDELRTMKWNSNPYSANDGGAGTEVLYGTPWLIAYWMLRYSGAIE